MKTFFNYSKYYSVTSMLLELCLPSFDTLIINSRVNLTRQLHCSNNSVIIYIYIYLYSQRVQKVKK